MVLIIDFKRERYRVIQQKILGKQYYNKIRFAVSTSGINESDYDLFILHANNDTSGEFANSVISRAKPIIIFSGSWSNAPKLTIRNNSKVFYCSDVDIRDGIVDFFDRYFLGGEPPFNLIISKSERNKLLHVARHDLLNSLTALSYRIENLIKKIDATANKEEVACLIAPILEHMPKRVDAQPLIDRFVMQYGAILAKDSEALRIVEGEIEKRYEAICCTKEIDETAETFKTELAKTKEKIMRFAEYLTGLVSEADSIID